VRLLGDRHGQWVDVALVGSDKGNGLHVRRCARELGIEARVHFLGFVPQADLIGLYRGAAALAYPSTFGPENLPPLEAFALGCPVVAARVSGSEEQLGDAAALFAPSSAEELAAAVAQVLTDTGLRADLVKRGLARARQFTTDDFALGVFRVIDEMARIRAAWGRPQ
jgi:glycosyltransferase involved in cell wall biosynthesis